VRGDAELIAMRRGGMKPAYVWVNDFACKTDWERFSDCPTLCVDGDTPELLDFRCVVGCTAIFLGDDPIRMERFVGVISPIAKRVIASVCMRNGDFMSDVSKIIDTTGVMNWPN